MTVVEHRPQMHVRKRNGDSEPVDVGKIVRAVERVSADLLEIDPLRVIDIVGLHKQADGGTHVLSTLEVGRVRVTGTESKGKGNKRIRLAVEDAERDV